MHPEKKVWNKLTLQLVREAAFKAIDGKSNQHCVIKFKENFEENCARIYNKMLRHQYDKIHYNHKILYNYKKKRILSYCDLEHRIVMHTLMLMAEPKRKKVSIDVAYNCLPKHGINAKIKNYSFNHRIKSDFFEGPEDYWMQLDLRKCYQSTNGKIVLKTLKELYGKGYFTDILKKSSVCELGIPIGTPMSPFIHHLLLIKFDRFCKEVLKIKKYRRYADDIFIMGTKEELHAWSWRIRFFLYYECGYLVKDNLKIRPIRVAPDIGGNVYHKTQMTSGHHNKGYVTTRKSIKRRALRKPSEPAYFGIMMHSDSINLMRKRMQVTELVDKLTINRALDSPMMDISDLRGPVTILDYDARPKRIDKKSGKEKQAWVKVQFCFKIRGESVRRVRCFKGSFPGIAESLAALDDLYRDAAKDHDMPVHQYMRKLKVLPIMGVEFEDCAGWVIKGTNNQLTELTDEEYDNIINGSDQDSDRD